MVLPAKPIHELSSDCRKSIEQTFPLECQLLSKWESTFIEMLDILAKERNRSETQWTIYALSVRKFRLLLSAKDAILGGFYEVGNTLLRAVHETSNLTRYFIKDTSAADKWLHGKEYDQKFLREQLQLDPEWYRILSRLYAHPNSRVSLWGILNLTSTKRGLFIYPRFRRGECYRSLLTFLWEAWFTIVTLREAFNQYPSSNKEWMRNHAPWDHTFFDYFQSINPKDLDPNIRHYEKVFTNGNK